MNTAVLISTFLAASIEVIEMVAIVVAVGATRQWRGALAGTLAGLLVLAVLIAALGTARRSGRDRKSTRLNSSHSQISYAVFCLKKKKETKSMLFCADLKSDAKLLVLNIILENDCV